MRGVRLLMVYPEMIERTCDKCQRFLYLDGPGGFGPPVMRGGQHQPRREGSALPCGVCPKIEPDEPKSPEYGRKSELTDSNWLAYRHYLECKAIGKFPDDPIVRRNAGLIRMVEDQAGQSELVSRLDRIAKLLSMRA